MAFDNRDPDTQMRARPKLLERLAQDLPFQPRLAFVKTPVWDHAETDTKGAFAELAAHLGENIDEVELPDMFNDAVEQHRVIMEADLARSFAPEYDRGRDKLSSILREMIERGQQVLAVDYNNAVGRIPVFNRALDNVFDWHDAILTPATTGEAPVGLESTGSPIFCTIWSMCGMPAITLPILQGAHGMPLGVQLVGPRNDDTRLLQTARWLVNIVEG
jgi:Asp-tRNA(Asn)/Glu-tRNA(Gln) amidotransferase A subunit family amidase